MTEAQTEAALLGGRKCAVAIVNYNTADLVIAGLPALIDELAPLDKAQIIIVDNLSPNGDADRLERYLQDHPGIARVASVVRSPRNGGFAAGNNVAFRAIDQLAWTPDFVWLLNPDTAVRPGALAAMTAVLGTHPQAGFVGARLENADGSTWSPAFNFPSAGTEFAAAAGLGFLQKMWPLLADVGAAATKVDWVGGASVLLREAARAALGEMDEGYFLYFEEVDYMRRGAEAGWETWTAPGALVLHIAGSATGLGDGASQARRMPGYWHQSWSRYFAKNHGATGARLAALGVICGALLRIAHRGLRGRRSGLPARHISDFAGRVLLRRLTLPPDARKDARAA